MDRRTFVFAFSAAGLSLSTPLQLALASGCSNVQFEQIMTLLGNPDDAEFIGKAHENSNLQQLKEVVCNALPKKATTEELGSILSKRVRKDMEDGDIRIVKGWVIPETSASLSALQYGSTKIRH